MSKSSRPKAAPTPAATGPFWGERLREILARHSSKLGILLVLIATARIAAVYPVYNHTIDEPFHLASGMEWLDKGVYRYSDEQPPLAPLMAAIGPKLAGAHHWGREGNYNEGAAILYDGRFEVKRYEQLLTLARIGILPFFWLLCGAVFVWARQWLGAAEAVIAVFLISCLPPVLAHAGLATTDMALMAGFACAVVSALLWLENPSWRNAIIFGACSAVMVLAKFSALLYFPAFVIAFAAMARPRIHWPSLGLAIAAGALLIWAGYRFSFGKGPWGFAMPAPELFSGINTLRAHNKQGHPAYLFGELSKTGWWYYYFVVLAVKTPLPVLILAAIGVPLAWKKRSPAALAALAVAVAILAVTMFASINIGVRHILPVYLGLTMLGAIALVHVLKNKTWSLAGVALAAVLIGGGAISHPDYLAYFNVLTGSEPEKVLADSDLDWGQDMKRLSARLRELGATQVTFSPFISAHLERVHGFPQIQPSDPVNPSPGWNAVSITELKTARLGLFFDYPEVQLWPDRYKPSERVGQGVLLYYFPPQR